MPVKEVVICSPVRTAIGTYGGTLKDTPAVDLGAAVIRATIARAKLAANDIGTVPCPGDDKIRSRDQPQGCKGDRPPNTAFTAAARRRDY
jgi:hypothetical protein